MFPVINPKAQCIDLCPAGRAYFQYVPSLLKTVSNMRQKYHGIVVHPTQVLDREQVRQGRTTGHCESPAARVWVALLRSDVERAGCGFTY